MTEEVQVQEEFINGNEDNAQGTNTDPYEEAARAQVNTAYLDVVDQVRLIREQIENKQRQMDILAQRRATTVRTRELYQEQYKLGTRTVVDLLNAEQAIHSAAQEIETARYDIYPLLFSTFRSPVAHAIFMTLTVFLFRGLKYSHE